MESKKTELKEKRFIDLNTIVFVNKKTGQRSISLPQRKLKDFEKGDMPHQIKIRVYKWWT